MNVLTLVCLVVSGLILAFLAAVALTNPKLFLLIFKNLLRNKQRTGITAMAIMALVVLVSLIWTVVSFLDAATEEKSHDIKLIVTERWQLPSQLPMAHGRYLDPNSPDFLPELKGLIGKDDYMSWSFYGGSTDQKNNTRETLVFMFCMNPDHIKPMMDSLQDLPDEMVAQLKADPRNVLLGQDRITQLNMKVGDRFNIYSMNYKGIDLEFKIVGILPGTQYNLMGIMNADYFNKALDTWLTNPNNSAKQQRHELDQRRLNLVWLRVRDKDSVAKVAQIIENSPKFADRPLKCETASSGVASFIDAYRDLLWGMKWLVVPSLLISMTLVISNAIAITVRERRSEMAVMKVLGFRPIQVQILVLGEAILVGGLSGFAAALGTIAIIDWVYGGIAFPIAFFPAFEIPLDALAWGFAIGAGTGVLGSFLPAWTARSVKVSEVFSKVA
jgi:putative ABC transport system permease protein